MRTGKDAKTDRLFGWFPGKRFLRFPMLAAKNEAEQACPLSVAERVMFAYLASRTADRECTSLSEIARETGLNRTSAVISGRHLLLGLGLLNYHKDKSVALEPEGWVRDFFRFPKKLSNSPHWSARYQYCWYIPAGKSLPVISQAVHWLLWSYSDGAKVPISQEALAVQLGVTAKTIKKALSPLADAGLMRLYTDGKLTAGFLRPSVETLKLFPGRRGSDGTSAEAQNHLVESPGVVYPGNTPKEPHRSGTDDVSIDSQPVDARDVEDVRYKAIDAVMKGIKLTEEEVDLINNLNDRAFAPRDMRYCVDIYRKLGTVRFVGLFNEASREHKRNKQDERRGDCFALFRWKVQNHLGDIGIAS
jgi:hypothetical protein